MKILSVFLILGLLLVTPTSAGPLGDAAKKGDVAEIDRLLKSGVDANESDPMASPLHWAAMNGHSAAVGLLVTNGANLEAKSNMLGTPLHAAAKFNRVEVVSKLISAGADPNSRDRDEFTPLMRAVVENRVEATKVLLSSGADVNAVGVAPRGRVLGYGPTIALHIASRNGFDEVAELLRASGAGPIPPKVPSDLAQRGDPVKGRELAYQDCNGCHRLEESDPPLTKKISFGPHLLRLIGRPVAQFPDFEFTEALVSFGGTWTPERLYIYSLTPSLTVPGTHMQWTPPTRTPDTMAHIISYFVSASK